MATSSIECANCGAIIPSDVSHCPECHVEAASAGEFDHPIAEKESDWYRYYSNDFQEHRFFEWHSIWYQAKEAIVRPDVHSVVEFGPGRGVTGALVEHFEIDYLGVDVDSVRFRPDEVSTVLDFDADRTFDMVCAFQVLEHQPFEELEDHLLKLRDISETYVYISLPFAGRYVGLTLNVAAPKVHRKIKRARAWRRLNPQSRTPDDARTDVYNPHYWEVGDEQVPKQRMRRILDECGLDIIDEFHNPLHPKHIFYMTRIEK